MRSTRTRVVVSIVLLWMFAGMSLPAPATTRFSADDAARVQRTILPWLECEECTDGELEAVVSLRVEAVASLRATLHGGPSGARLAAFRDYLVKTYGRMKKHAGERDVSLPMSEDKYIKIHMEKLVARFQIRAAMALSEIGGKEATRALEESKGAQLSDEAKEYVETLLKREARQSGEQGSPD